MKSNGSAQKIHRRRLILLAACTLISLSITVIATGFLISSKKQQIVDDAVQTCREELDFMQNRLKEWSDSTQSLIATLAQDNLFRTFLSDYAASEAGIARFDAMKDDVTSDEYEFFHYLQDTLADVARLNGMNASALLLPDGKPLLGKYPGIDRHMLSGKSSMRVAGFSVDKETVFASTVTAVFPLGQEDVPRAYLVLGMPMTSFAKVLSSETHHEMKYGLTTEQGTLSLRGGKVLFQPQPCPSSPEGMLIEENAECRMYRRISEPLEGRIYASIPEEILAGREARVKWEILLFAILAGSAIFLLALALFFAESASMESKLNQRIRLQNLLLQSINSSVENGIILMSPSGSVQYKNKYFPGEEWDKTPLASILPESAASHLLGKTADVIREGKSGSTETTIEENGGKRLYRVSIFPYLAEKGGQAKALAVLLFTDITEFRKRALEQKRRVESLLDVFACAMESVDKGFRGHTHKMLSVIDLIRTDLKLSSDEVQTLAIAARLQSISKLFIPHEILTKQGKLTDEERARISQAQTMASHMIQNFDFRLPVSATLDQISEKWDGTGKPNGLKGEAILKTARVLSAVNSFSAMTSPRSYRAALSPQEAIAQLKTDGGYDQDIISCLGRIDALDLEKITEQELPSQD